MEELGARWSHDDGGGVGGGSVEEKDEAPAGGQERRSRSDLAGFVVRAGSPLCQFIGLGRLFFSFRSDSVAKGSTTVTPSASSRQLTAVSYECAGSCRLSGVRPPSSSPPPVLRPRRRTPPGRGRGHGPSAEPAVSLLPFVPVVPLSTAAVLSAAKHPSPAVAVSPPPVVLSSSVSAVCCLRRMPRCVRFGLGSSQLLMRLMVPTGHFSCFSVRCSAFRSYFSVLLH